MSADLILGTPFNIASYALLTMMVAQVTGMKAGEFVYTLGDAHVYLNHIDIYKKEQQHNLIYPSPTLRLNPSVDNLFEFKTGDFSLLDYASAPTVKYPIAV